MSKRIVVALALALSLVVVAPRESGAGEKQQSAFKQRLGRFVPKWFRGRQPPPVVKTSSAADLHASPVIEHQRASRPLIPRGSVEHKNAIETVTQDAKAKYGGRLPNDVIERIAREAVDQVWHADGIAITNFVTIIAQRHLKDRAEALLAK